MSKKYRVLVDLDGVQADFDGRMVEEWKRKWPKDPAEMILSRNVFEVSEIPDFVSDAREKFNEIYLAEGFYGSLKPIMSGLGFSAINEMVENGHDVYLLTSPGSRSVYAPSEKCIWAVSYTHLTLPTNREV